MSSCDLLFRPSTVIDDAPSGGSHGTVGRDSEPQGASSPDSVPPGSPGRSSDDDYGDQDLDVSVVVRPTTKTRKPAMYRVLMLNDDYTPMEFVVHVLERFFSKTRDEATAVMLQVHQRGVGVCGVFTYEVAESKVTQVMDLARQNQHPLQCTLEKD